mgnify:CR=1 FL=1
MARMQLEISTSGGAVRGRERNGAALFAGIPYAAPPVGRLRWAPPQPADPWTGVRDATRFGPAAPQLPGDGLTNSHEVRWDEDCLTLNVVTPGPDDAGRAVMVWLHGGAFRHGTGATPWYDGTSFALRGDIVVVTINYRLGALGFCRLDGEQTSGINGILDQIAALEWVRHNIAAFGGDPAKVTIAGESAGAFSVSTLTAMPQADGLFRGAVAQSGAGHHAVDAATADLVADRFLAELGAGSIDEARSRSALEILRAQARVEEAKAEFMSRVDQPFYPVADGVVLPARPVDLIAERGASVPMLTGTNADEMTLWGLGAVDDERLQWVLGQYAQPVEQLLPAYREELPAATAGEIAIAYAGDRTFRIPAVRLAEARHAHEADTWMYLFSWKSRAFGGALGATHALDIGFVFNTLDAAGFDVFLGTDDPPTGLAETMHDVWAAFIKTGRPHTDTVNDWPSYTPDDRAVLEFGDEVRLLDDPGAVTRKAWEGIR